MRFWQQAEVLYTVHTFWYVQMRCRQLLRFWFQEVQLRKVREACFKKLVICGAVGVCVSSCGRVCVCVSSSSSCGRVCVCVSSCVVVCCCCVWCVCVQDENFPGNDESHRIWESNSPTACYRRRFTGVARDSGRKCRNSTVGLVKILALQLKFDCRERP